MFTLEIRTDNDAFFPARNREVVRIMRELISRLVVDGLDHRESGGKLRDVNGNTVGSWAYTPEEEGGDNQNTTTCRGCGYDFPDRDMIPAEDAEGGEWCPKCVTQAYTPEED